MSSHWIRLGPNPMTVFIRGETFGHRERHTGRMLGRRKRLSDVPTNQEATRVPSNPQKLGGGKEGPSPRAFRESVTLPTP